MNKLIDKLKKCDGCTKQFTVPDTMNSWFESLKEYSSTFNNDLKNPACRNSWNKDKDALVPEKFMGCLKSFLQSKGGRNYARNINMNKDKTKITSFRQDIDLILIEDSANDGVEVLLDLRKICNEAKLGDTYSFT